MKKEQKLFFFDWNSVVDLGGRFENFVAVHLIKWIFFEQDVFGRNIDLRFYKDKAGHEVDFVVVENNLPILFIEAKLGDSENTTGLKYLKKKFPNVRALQVHLNGKKEYVSKFGIECIHVNKLLNDLI